MKEEKENSRYCYDIDQMKKKKRSRWLHVEEKKKKKNFHPSACESLNTPVNGSLLLLETLWRERA